MKKKVLVIIAAAALIVTAFKTGYPYYESQTKALAKQNSTTKLEYVSNSYQETANTASEEPKQISPEEPTVDVSTNTEIPDQYDVNNIPEEDNYEDGPVSGGCCGSGPYSMLDENGNFKTPEVFEKELEEGVKNGELTSEDKEYLLDVYNECYGFYSNNSQQSTDDAF